MINCDFREKKEEEEEWDEDEEKEDEDAGVKSLSSFFRHIIGHLWKVR